MIQFSRAFVTAAVFAAGLAAAPVAMAQTEAPAQAAPPAAQVVQPSDA